MRQEYDGLVDDTLVLACVDDFCRLTLTTRHRAGGNGGEQRGGWSDAARATPKRETAPPHAAGSSEVDAGELRLPRRRHHQVRRQGLGIS